MRGTYRVCAHVEDNEMRLGLCEVVTDKDGATKCVAVASTGVFATLDEMKRGLERMRAACELPPVMIADGDKLSECFEESIEAADLIVPASCARFALRTCAYDESVSRMSEWSNTVDSLMGMSP